MSHTVTTTELTDKQRRILKHLRAEVPERTYFKSRLIGADLGLSASEVGTNMDAIREGGFDVTVERWGKSGGTTWKITAKDR
jgi:tRNA G26 N,N-dimethylase Trm1